MARGGDVRGLENSKKEVIVGRYAWFTLAILSSTLLTVFFSETMLLPAIPEIIKEFKIPYGTAAWIFSAYLEENIAYFAQYLHSWSSCWGLCI